MVAHIFSSPICYVPMELRRRSSVILISKKQAVGATICPSSHKMGHQSGVCIGGSGLVACMIMPNVFDAASGVGGSSSCGP